MFLQPDPEQEGSWQGLLFDVTARKEAEEQLRASELVHSATVEHLPAIVYREPPERAALQEMYIGPQVEQILGYTAEEWIAGDARLLGGAHPPRRRRGRARRQPGSPTKRRRRSAQDYRFRHRDGRYLWVHDEATFVSDIGGGWWQGFIIDITERKEAEEQLREAEEKFRLIVEQGPAVIYQQEFDVEDPSVSRTTYISPQQADMFGYTSEEVLADPTLWSRTVHPDDRDRVLAADVESNRDGNGRFSLEYRMISKDGRIVWVEDTSLLVAARGAAPLLAGIPDRHHRAQAGGGTARPCARGRARGHAAPAGARRDEEHVPPGGVARPAHAAGGDPRARDHPGARRRAPRGGRREGSGATDRGQRPAAGSPGDEPARPRSARARHRGAEPAADRRRLDRAARAGRVRPDPRCPPAHRHPPRDGPAPTAPRSSGSSRTCSRTPSGTRRRPRRSG